MGVCVVVKYYFHGFSLRHFLCFLHILYCLRATTILFTSGLICSNYNFRLVLLALNATTSYLQYRHPKRPFLALLDNQLRFALSSFYSFFLVLNLNYLCNNIYTFFILQKRVFIDFFLHFLNNLLFDYFSYACLLLSIFHLLFCFHSSYSHKLD